jgi:hypothetical protein
MCVLVLAFLCWVLLPPALNNGLSGKSVTGIIVLIFIIFTYVAQLLFMPLWYELTADALVVKRLLTDRTVPYNQIAGIYTIPDTEQFNGAKLLGNGGLLGYSGIYYTTQVGRYYSYATKRVNRILIKTKSDEKLLLTPDDLHLTEELKKRLGTAGIG